MNSLVGCRFGRLVVLERFYSPNSSRVFWTCRCDCGNIKNVSANHLVEGATTSCGCFRGELGANRLKRYLNINGSSRRGKYGESNFKRLYNLYKRSAVRRKIQFDLSLDEFRELTSQKCFYCGDAPKSVAKWKGTYGEYVYNGIDRVDNDSGYILKNCVACCWICNQAKKDMEQSDFINWVIHTAKNLERKLTER